MKKLLFTLITLLCACASLPAQNTQSCNADFTYTVDGNTVKFAALPTTASGLIHYWQFGDGTGADNTSQPVHTYHGPGSYRVLHYVKDELRNCKDSVSKVITITTVACNIEAKFEWKQDELNCLKVQFINRSVPISPNVRFYWKFGDGGGSYDTNPSHFYNQPGEYEVCLVIDAGNNCTKSFCEKIKVVCEPTCAIQPDFKWEQDPQNCLAVSFYNKTIISSSAAKLSWKFGDGTGSEEWNPKHVYKEPGTYEVCLVVETSNTCRKEICRKIEIRCPDPCIIQPKFEWKIDPQDPHTVYFNNLTAPVLNAVFFKWTFGDGSSSGETNPVHKYERPGTYKVCLVVETANGCRKEFCSEVTVVFVVCPIELKFEWKRDAGNPLKIYFYSQTATTGIQAKYKWSFGDGTGSDEANPVHVYQQPGIYKVCLVVEFSNGCRKETCQEIGIRLCDVKAKYEWKKDPNQWNKVHFANLSEPVSRIWRTTWSYGDGTASADFNTYHTYNHPGTYRVCLKVQSLEGCISEYCDTVVVRFPQVNCDIRSEFSFHRTTNNSLEFKFEPVHKSPNLRYYWSFGDGTISNEIAPVHRFPRAGKYKVCLTVAANNVLASPICRSTTCKEITAGADCENVKVEFKYQQDPEQPNKVSFYAWGTEPIVKQRWIISLDTANGIYNPWYVVLEQNNPTYVFKQKGWYVVCLKAVTASGCEKSYCERIFIEKVVNRTTATNLSIPVYPNPAKEKISLNLKASLSELINISVLDNTGTRRIALEYRTEAGNNIITIPVEKLSAGIYYVEIKSGSQNLWAKFQKL